jgi:hypothetical protein
VIAKYIVIVLNEQFTERKPRIFWDFGRQKLEHFTEDSRYVVDIHHVLFMLVGNEP